MFFFFIFYFFYAFFHLRSPPQIYLYKGRVSFVMYILAHTHLCVSSGQKKILENSLKIFLSRIKNNLQAEIVSLLSHSITIPIRIPKNSTRSFPGVNIVLDRLTLLILRLLSSKAQECRTFFNTLLCWYSLENSRWVVSDEYPCVRVSVIFQLFAHHFLLAKLATSSTRAKRVGDPLKVTYT